MVRNLKTSLYVFWCLLGFAAKTALAASVCEGDDKPLSCLNGTLISIESASYGLRKDTTCVSDDYRPTKDCFADGDEVLRILRERLPAICDERQIYSSQLIFTYQCKNVRLWPTTSPPVTEMPPTTAALCQSGQTKISDCYNYICDGNQWQQSTPDRTNTSCCALWDGCNIYTEPSTIATASTEISTLSSSTVRQYPMETSLLTILNTLFPTSESTIDSVPSFTSPDPNYATSQMHVTYTQTPTYEVDRHVEVVTNVPDEVVTATSDGTMTDTPDATIHLSSFFSKVSSASRTQHNHAVTETSTLLRAAPTIDYSNVPGTTRYSIPPLECPAEVTSVPYSLSWPRTSANTMRTLPCEGDTRQPASQVRRTCSVQGKWLPVDTSLCPSVQIQKLINKSLDSEDLQVFTKQLADVSKDNDLTSGDISAIARLINDVKEVIPTRIAKGDNDTVINITRNVLLCGDSLLNDKTNNAWQTVKETEKSSKAMEVIDAMESMARETAARVNSDVEVKTTTIELNVKVVPSRELKKNSSLVIESSKGYIQFPIENFISTSGSGKTNATNGKLITVFYDHTNIWSKQGDLALNTPVFSASVLDSRSTDVARRPLDVPFRYSLKNSKPSERDGRHCVYWDDNSDISFWSSDGCRQIESADDYSVCECDHLTNFAVLMDVTGVSEEISEEHKLSLRIITYAGCIISIICLFFSWLTFQFLKNLSSDRNTIHKHLVFNLMLAEAIFLVAMSPGVVSMEVLCSVIAGLLHFLFLCVFAWTCLEGIQLYIMLIEVFEAERSRTMYYYLVGYGLPAAVVGISAGIDRSGYGTNTVCWLKPDTGFIYSFVGPVIAVMAVNLIMLGIAIYMMYNHSRMVANIKHKETTRADSIRAWIKGAIVLVVLLGLTWIFGFLFVSKDSLVFAYLFTILNSLQGLFIFIFHCFGNEKVQKEYKKLVRRTQWLPNCIRVHYGEHKGLNYANSSSSANYLSRYFARRKSSDYTGSMKSRKQLVSPLSSSNSNGNASNSYDESTISKEPLTTQSKVSGDYSQSSKACGDESAVPFSTDNQQSPC